MEEILIAVKNKEIDEDSALDIMLEFIEKSKEIKVKNILKLLSKNLLSLENASKMINAMSNLNDSKYNNAQKSNYYEDDTSNFKLSSKKSISNVKELKTKQKRAARPLEKEEYDEIMELCKNGFEYYDNGKKRKFRPNEQLAMTFLLQANLGLRISDVLTLTPSTLKNDKLEIIEKKTRKLQYRDINKNLKSIIYEYALEHNIKADEYIIKLKRRGVHKQLSIITNYLKLSNISSHSFRKLYSMTVYNSTDGDIELLKELLNHSSIATTQKYIRRTQDEINKVSASIDFTYSW
ncbi:tyrosine-type recombinase/integrase [Clostridium butyricum]|uniref:Site-specific recombinase, phage integrase family n=1 Tax=Clostridium butyricum E4 str. BoNT E BL5262 TaxID=632245 RepID=C4IG50_CLOBU|nr:tyrosine-type recombinase/integrase [Clostridium butyricum]EDT75206.1 putative integrase/recombinase [Clostridium butyricum 5521]EEP54119.1 site-specific recombinase, phage integrase family [Clostridium butyricum E4 str. BoNT E BL5262]NFS18582.1 integrase [Clostridium butyricum]